MTDATILPDLASRALGGAIVATNDQSFCPADNLIKPAAPVFQPHTFDERGQIYDGWETRRRREPGDDWVIVRLAAPAVIRAVVVDTAFFVGNYPEQCLVEGAWLDGYPSAPEVAGAGWTPLSDRVPLAGDATNLVEVADPRRFTHVRLRIVPDGGVARLRVHGEVVPDPGLLSLLPADLAALVNGGRAVGCSDSFFAAPDHMLMPGLARTTGDGWESRRRRDAGNDWAVVQLAALGHVRLVELDTSQFRFNAPGWAALTGFTPDGAEVVLLPRTRLQPDTPHRFPVDGQLPPVERVRLDIYPDGGIARLRVWGPLADAGLAALRARWEATAGT